MNCKDKVHTNTKNIEIKKTESVIEKNQLKIQEQQQHKEWNQETHWIKGIGDQEQNKLLAMLLNRALIQITTKSKTKTKNTIQGTRK